MTARVLADFWRHGRPVTLTFCGDDPEEAAQAACDYADRTGLTTVRITPVQPRGGS